MTRFDPTQGAQSVYNFWLGLVPQFLGQFNGAKAASGANGGAGASTGSAAPLLNALIFPADQIAKSAAMTQQSLQHFAQAVAPMLQSGGVSNLLSQWASAVSGFTRKPGDGADPATAATHAMLAPWQALISNIALAAPAAPASSAPESGAPMASVLPLQAMGQAWVDLGSRLAGATPEQLRTAFDRTYGALGDALGLGVMRELYEAWQDMLTASTAHQEARANYAVLVQSALAQGLQRLITRLAEKANTGERIDSVLALLRLWAISTEEVMHETLQSEAGLAATAALTRSASTYRKRMQYVPAVLAGLLDLATRRELDEAYREIQVLKRELRALRPARGPASAAPRPARARKARVAPSIKRRTKD
jgi:Poly(R)-hydroxyalkanoic acid synthase subunit (PHA_synth_III_E)